ncbi:hypothetical protein VC562_28875, partial [Citrobacter freundii]|nr:hypothetical protein [Citrobacter freundii]MEB0410282.1 hypothetical protein [Citrobacter freundii]
MVNTTIGVMNKAKDHTVTQKITRIKRMYGRNIIILDYENEKPVPGLEVIIRTLGNDSNLLIVFYVQIMPDDLVMQLHR